MTTWGDLVREARECLEADYPTREDREILRGWEDSGEWHEHAHEYADGHGRVIYYSQSRALFADGLLDEYEEEAQEIGDGTIDTIDRWISTAAYCALRSAYLEAVTQYLEDHKIEEA
jgi:hypothetical protein